MKSNNTDKVIALVDKHIPGAFGDDGFGVDQKFDPKYGQLAVFISLKTSRGFGENGFVLQKAELCQPWDELEPVIVACVVKAKRQCLKRQGFSIRAFKKRFEDLSL